jgi:hypothetical protein
MQRMRLEFTHTLDAPHNHQPGLNLPRPSGRIKRQVLLVDLNRLPGRQRDLAALRKLIDKHPTYVYDRRLVAVDGGASPGEITARISRPAAPSLFWRWLVNPDHPPIEWVPDPEPQAVAALFEVRPALFRSRQRGGRGGGGFSWICSHGQVIDRLEGQTDETSTHPMVSALQPTCRDKSERPVLAPLAGPWLGRVRSAGSDWIGCQPGETPVGIFGNAGALVDGVGLLCSGNRSKLIGTPGGSGFELRCPPGHVLAGLTGRATRHIHAVGIVCQDYSKPPPTATAAPDLPSE